MGLYGTPEHLPPLKSEIQSMKWICRACKMEYRGNYCPYCGTKTGSGKGWHVFHNGGIFICGMLAGGLFMFLGFLIGDMIR